MMKSNSEKKRRRMGIAQSRYFTIIELLIVISILTILCAILLPALSRARDAGLASDCRGREKQIGVAFMMYSTDYNHYLPLGYAGYSASCTGDPKERSWIHKLSPYLGGNIFPNEQSPSCGNVPESSSPFVMRKSFYWCKSPVVPTSFRNNTFPYGGNSQDRFRYAMNSILNATSFGVIASAGTSCGYKTMKLVKTPASTLLIGECYGEYPIYSWWSFLNSMGTYPIKGNPICCFAMVMSMPLRKEKYRAVTRLSSGADSNVSLFFHLV